MVSPVSSATVSPRNDDRTMTGTRKVRSAEVFSLRMAAGAAAVASWRTLGKKSLRLGLPVKTAGVRSAGDLSSRVRQAQAEATMDLTSVMPKGNGTGTSRLSQSG